MPVFSRHLLGLFTALAGIAHVKANGEKVITHAVLPPRYEHHADPKGDGRQVNDELAKQLYEDYYKNEKIPNKVAYSPATFFESLGKENPFSYAANRQQEERGKKKSAAGSDHAYPSWIPETDFSRQLYDGYYDDKTMHPKEAYDPHKFFAEMAIRGKAREEARRRKQREQAAKSQYRKVGNRYIFYSEAEFQNWRQAEEQIAKDREWKQYERREYGDYYVPSNKRPRRGVPGPLPEPAPWTPVAKRRRDEPAAMASRTPSPRDESYQAYHERLLRNYMQS